MARDLFCPHCGAYVGNCGHVPGGLTGPATLSGTCGKCEREYSVTCNGDCLKEYKDNDNYDVNISAPTPHVPPNISKGKKECPTCGGTGKILKTCPRCNGTGEIEETTTKECSRCGGSGQILGKCAMCNGTGMSNTGNVCQGCGGTGNVYKFCPVCNGSGKIEETIKKDCPKCYCQGQIVEACPTCHGLGEI